MIKFQAKLLLYMPLITDNATLATLCQALKTEEFITVDTEFLRDKTYFPQLCLIQIASSQGAFAVDPLVDGIDLSPVFDILTYEPVLKVFHSARQDIEILLMLSGNVPTPLFDTQVAAMVCGFGEAASYETLVTKLAKQSIDKSCRFTDWSRRPLTTQQYDYALSDVVHLREVYVSLQAMLQKAERHAWLEDEMATLLDPENYRVAPEDAWKRIKIKTNSPRFVQLVKALAEWREITAQAYNLPRNHLLKEQALLDIAATAPKTLSELDRIRQLGGIAGNHTLANEIVELVCKTLTQPAPSVAIALEEVKLLYPNTPLTDLLKVLLKTVCSTHDVAEKLIATSQELCAIAHAENQQDLMALPAMQGWRFELFGQLALQLKEGKIALSAQGDKMCIVNLAQHKELVG